jgi:glycosyltransferase involved in cell wall biosynthesis
MDRAGLNGATVSVVMPVYNGGRTVSRALDSVFAQEVAPFEVIAVDDGSTDGTRALLQSYVPRGLTICLNERNLGAAGARNRGAAAARGTFIAFIDADDQWHPEKLARQLAGLAAAGPDIKASCTGFRLITPTGEDVVDYAGEPVEIGTTEFARGCHVGPGSTLMVATESFRAVGPFDTSLRRFEDWDWLLRYTRICRLRLEHEALATVFDDRAGHGATTLTSLLALGRKHRALGTFQSIGARLEFESTLLLERGAVHHRAGQRPQAALWAAAALALYPPRLARTWPSLRRALHDLAKRGHGRGA